MLYPLSYEGARAPKTIDAIGPKARPPTAVRSTCAGAERVGLGCDGRFEGFGHRISRYDGAASRASPSAWVHIDSRL